MTWSGRFRRRLGGGASIERSAAPLVRRRWVLVAVLATATVVAGLGLASPWLVKSPQQLAAESAPPSPSVVTAPVEQREVSQTVVLRGEVTSQQVFEVTPAAGQEGASPVVTEVRVERGQEVEPGEVLLVVSGRPLLALPGGTPAYRDLRPGAEGEDVAQLQRALRELGYGQLTDDGRFGAATKRAVAAFYEDRGYPPATTGDDTSVEAARSEVTSSKRRLEDARRRQEDSAGSGEQDSADIEVERAEEDLDAARKRLSDLEATTGPMLPRSEYLFLPSFPARVHSLDAQVGSPVSEPVIGLASGPLVVEAQASTAQAELMTTELPVEIHPEGADSMPGTIASIAEAETTGGDGGPGPNGQTVTIVPESDLDAELAGQGLRVTIEVVSSDGKVLAVPVSGLFAAPDGSVYVIRRAPSGEELTVTVEPGVSGDGYVAVDPESGELEPGDQIVVGSQTGGAASPDGR